MMTRDKSIEIFFNRAIHTVEKWENPDKSGLLLRGCPKCGSYETRDDYGRHWPYVYTLRQSESARAIARCNCGQWLKIYY